MIFYVAAPNCRPQPARCLADAIVRAEAFGEQAMVLVKDPEHLAFSVEARIIEGHAVFRESRYSTTGDTVAEC